MATVRWNNVPSVAKGLIHSNSSCYNTNMKYSMKNLARNTKKYGFVMKRTGNSLFDNVVFLYFKV